MDSPKGNLAIGMTNVDAITLLCTEILQPVVFSLANTADFLLGRKEKKIFLFTDV